MRRALVLLVACCLLSGPVSRVVCGWDCDWLDDVTASESCHDTAGDELSVTVSAEHCDDLSSTLPDAVLAKLGTGLALPAFVWLSSGAPSGGTARPWFAGRSRGPSTDPPISHLTPLRI